MRRMAPCLAIRNANRLKIVQRPRYETGQSLLDDTRDIEKPDPALQEGVDGHLVGRVQDSRSRAPCLQGLSGQVECRKASKIRYFKGQLGNGEIGRAHV